MKILTISVALIALSGCAANCFEKAAVTKLSITTARESAVELAYDGKISKGQAQEVQTILDVAKATAENGAALCMQDKKSALDLISAAGKSLTQATQIVGDNNGN